VALHLCLARHEALRVDDAPVREIRRDVDALDLVDERFRIERPEEARALEVRAHDARDVGALRVAEEIGNGDRQRLDVALGHVDTEVSSGRRGKDHRHAEEKDEHTQQKFHSILQRYWPIIWRGSKWKGLISRHKAYLSCGSL